MALVLHTLAGVLQSVGVGTRAVFSNAVVSAKRVVAAAGATSANTGHNMALAIRSLTSGLQSAADSTRGIVTGALASVEQERIATRASILHVSAAARNSLAHASEAGASSIRTALRQTELALNVTAQTITAPALHTSALLTNIAVGSVKRAQALVENIIRASVRQLATVQSLIRGIAQPAAPTEQLAAPEATAEKIALRSGSLELVAAQDKPMQVVTGFRFTSVIKPTRPATSITDTFHYTGPDENGVWTAEGKMPDVPGKFIVDATIHYADGSAKQLAAQTLIDPMGYVYEKTSRGELRVQNARVVLMQKQGGTWLPWPAQEYNQHNPQTTDATGQYTFLAPAGTYYLQVQREGYKSFRGDIFELTEATPINFNIEMKYLGKPL